MRWNSEAAERPPLQSSATRMVLGKSGVRGADAKAGEEGTNCAQKPDLSKCGRGQSARSSGIRAIARGRIGGGGIATERPGSLTWFGNSQGRASRLAFEANAGKPELDRRSAGDAQRSQCQSTSTPVSRPKKAEAFPSLSILSQLCQDLLTDPYFLTLFSRGSQARCRIRPAFAEAVGAGHDGACPSKAFS